MTLNRRQFLKYSSLAAAGFTFAACTGGGGDDQPAGEGESSGGEGQVLGRAEVPDFGTLEKTDLPIGIIPLTD